MPPLEGVGAAGAARGTQSVNAGNANGAGRKPTAGERFKSFFRSDDIKMTSQEASEFYRSAGVQAKLVKSKTGEDVARISVPKKHRASIIARHPIAFTIAGLATAALAGMIPGVLAGEDLERFKVQHAFSPSPGIAVPGTSGSSNGTGGYL